MASKQNIRFNFIKNLVSHYNLYASIHDGASIILKHGLLDYIDYYFIEYETLKEISDNEFNKLIRELVRKLYEWENKYKKFYEIYDIIKSYKSEFYPTMMGSLSLDIYKKNKDNPFFQIKYIDKIDSLSEEHFLKIKNNLLEFLKEEKK